MKMLKNRKKYLKFKIFVYFIKFGNKKKTYLFFNEKKKKKKI